MGGNALNLVGLQARRLSASEFDSLVSGVRNASQDVLHWIEPVKFYHTKPDMGDIDFVAHPKSDVRGKEIVEWGEKIMQRLGSKGYYYNKPVLSFEYQGVQIDIAAKYSDEAAKAYLEFCHYSPIGNVVGRMIKQTGAKWGIDGLVYPVRDGNDETSHMLGYIPLSTNIEAPMKLAGLDPEIWKAGFENEDDIYAFCVESRLFNKEIFAFENLNHINRKRDRLRKDYHAWLDYIKDKPDKYKRYENIEEKLQRKAEWFEVLREMFPESKLKEERAKLLEAADEKRMLNQKFNGNVVKELTGLEGKELGQFLTSFKKSFGEGKGYDAWIKRSSLDDIKAEVVRQFSLRP